jgi:hypothetical protein
MRVAAQYFYTYSTHILQVEYMKPQSIIPEGTVVSKWWMLRNDSTRKSNKCVKNTRKINK